MNNINGMNPMQLMQSLTRFKQSFTGNPQQMIEQAVQTGRLSQQQLNQAQQMASQIQQMLGSFKL